MEDAIGRRRHAQSVHAWRRPAVLMPLLAVLALITAVGLVLSLQLLNGGNSEAGSASAAEHSASPEPTASSAPPTANGRVYASAPERFSIEAAGIDVAVLPLTPSTEDLQSQSLIPPYTEDGYWLTPYGSPGQGSENTTYITGHSWSDREAPFDRLSTSTDVGDALTVTTSAGTLNYVVDTITTYDKNTLKDSEIWNIVPNRIVLISCYTEDPDGKNVVVTASPAA